MRSSIHIRSIRFSPRCRADVRTMQRIHEETTEELRDVMDEVRPLLRWPISRGAQQ